MFGKGRYGRPNRASLLAMMAVNGALALVIMTITLALFGVIDVIPEPMAAALHAHSSVPRSLVWPMLPGAAVAYGCLWYWLIVIGRSRGVPWGGAVIYGLIIALVNVPLGGFISGLVNGQSPAESLLRALIFLVFMLILPAWTLAVSLFGVAMGVCNGLAAGWWIERYHR